MYQIDHLVLFYEVFSIYLILQLGLYLQNIYRFFLINFLSNFKFYYRFGR